MARRVGFWVAQVLGYPVLLFLVWLWLAIPERSVPALLGSAALALVILGGLAWLLASAFSARFGRVLLLVLASAVLALTCSWLAGYADPAGNWIAARLSYWLRKPVNPRLWAARYWWLVWVLFAAVVFSLVPRFTIGVGTVARNWRFWLLSAALAVAGVYLPWKLVWWVPHVSSMAAETASWMVRFAAAYALWLGSLLLFAAGVRRFARQT